MAIVPGRSKSMPGEPKLKSHQPYSPETVMSTDPRFLKELVYSSVKTYETDSNYAIANSSVPDNRVLLSEPPKPTLSSFTPKSRHTLTPPYVTQQDNSDKPTLTPEPIIKSVPIYSSQPNPTSKQTFTIYQPQPVITIDPNFSTIQGLPGADLTASAFPNKQAFQTDSTCSSTVFAEVPNLQTQNLPDICSKSSSPSKNDFPDDLIEPSDLGISSEPEFSQEAILPSDIVISLEEAISAMYSASNISIHPNNNTLDSTAMGISLKRGCPSETDDFSQDSVLLPSDMVISLEEAISAICSEPDFPDKTEFISNKKDFEKPTPSNSEISNSESNKNNHSDKNKEIPSTVVSSGKEIMCTNPIKSVPVLTTSKSDYSSSRTISVEEAMAAMFSQTDSSLTDSDLLKSPNVLPELETDSSAISSSLEPLFASESSKSNVAPKCALSSNSNDIPKTITPLEPTPSLQPTSTDVVRSQGTYVSENNLGPTPPARKSESQNLASTESAKPTHSGPPPILEQGLHGKPIISLAGRRFSRQKKINGNKVRWFCSTHAPYGCKAYLHTLDNTIVKCYNKHNHKK